jgi:hypothetical protein
MTGVARPAGIDHPTPAGLRVQPISGRTPPSATTKTNIARPVADGGSGRERHPVGFNENERFQSTGIQIFRF